MQSKMKELKKFQKNILISDKNKLIKNPITRNKSCSLQKNKYNFSNKTLKKKEFQVNQILKLLSMKVFPNFLIFLQ